MRTFIARLRKPWQRPSFEIYTDNLADSARNIIRKSYEEARLLNHGQLNPEHVLIAFTKVNPEFFDRLLQRTNLSRQSVLLLLSAEPERLRSDGVRISESLNSFKNSLKRARERGRRRIEDVDICVALFEDARSLPASVFKKLGVDRDAIVIEMNDLIE